MLEDFHWNDQAQGLRDAVSRQRRGLKLVTVTSGKGGVGKSSLTVNIALALSQMGFRVLVVDADFGLANIDVMLGINARYNLSHLLRGNRSLDEIVQQGYQGVRFISGGSGVYDLLAMDGSQLEQIIGRLIKMRESVDVILFDTGAGINDNVLRMVSASTETVIVTTPEPTAILDAYALAKTISKQDDSPPVRVVMNKAESRKEAENAIVGFQAIIRKYLEEDVESLGYVLFDAEVTKSIKRQTPLLISHPTSQTAREIQTVARNLARLESGPPPRKSALARFFAKFSG
jgi:flagellar biosynthesis protein FlhG